MRHADELLEVLEFYEIGEYQPKRAESDFEYNVGLDAVLLLGLFLALSTYLLVFLLIE